MTPVTAPGPGAPIGGSHGERRPATTLSFGLRLAGWSELSVCGWDGLDTTWWAQLWPDGSRSDQPEMWLGYVPPIRTVAALARQVAAATGVDVGQVSEALSEAVEALEAGGGGEDGERA